MKIRISPMRYRSKSLNKHRRPLSEVQDILLCILDDMTFGSKQILLILTVSFFFGGESLLLL